MIATHSGGTKGSQLLGGDLALKDAACGVVAARGGGNTRGLAPAVIVGLSGAFSGDFAFGLVSTTGFDSVAGLTSADAEGGLGEALLFFCSSMPDLAE